MSQENIERAARGYAAFNERGVDGILEFLDPGVEWQTTVDQPDPAVYYGHDGVRNVIGGMLEVFDQFEIHVEDIDSVGDLVVVSVRMRVRGQGSGAEVELCESHVHELRSGKSIHVREYRTRREALEAVGLRE